METRPLQTGAEGGPAWRNSPSDDAQSRLQVLPWSLITRGADGLSFLGRRTASHDSDEFEDPCWRSPPDELVVQLTRARG